MAVWLLLVHLVPLSLLPVLPLPLWMQLTISAAALYGLFDAWHRQVRRNHPDSVCTINWKDTGHCQLTLKSGRQLDVSLSPQAIILPWLVILHFRTPSTRFRYQPVLADMLDDDVFRQLRVRLQIAIDQGTA